MARWRRRFGGMGGGQPRDNGARNRKHSCRPHGRPPAWFDNKCIPCPARVENFGEDAGPRPGTQTRGAGSAAALPTLLSVMFINLLGFGIVVPLLPFYAQIVPGAALADGAGLLRLCHRRVFRRAVLGPAVRHASAASPS